MTPENLTAQPHAVPIAIVGMACLFPRAGSLGMYWANIKQGVDGIGPIPASHWSPDDYFDADPKKPDFTYAKRGGFLEPVPFDPAAFGIAPNALEATDAAQLLGLVVASQALESAGYGHDRTWDRSRVSVVLGVTGTLQLVVPLGARLGHPQWRKALAEAGVSGDVAEDVVARIGDMYVPWQEASFPGLLGNVVAGRIANRLDLGGTNCVVDAACASSLSAIHLASLELASGKASMVVTGGVDAFNDIFMYMCFSKTPALSPSGDVRPYDAAGDGTILGEGVGMVVLKRLADAERDGDRIFAVLKGVGTASDGRGKAIYAPDSDGQRRALEAAYSETGIAPSTVELVEGHGTGTKVGDAIEVAALRSVYGEAPAGGGWVALGSVKSQIGHTKAAAGAAGLIKAALALHHKVLPPTIKVAQPLAPLAESVSPFYLTAKPRPWLKRAAHPRRAAVSSFGFGGSNFHLVLEEHDPAKPGADWDGQTELVAIGAPTRDALLERLGRYTPDMAWDALRIAATDDRAAFDSAAAHRLAFVVERGATDLAGTLSALRARVAEGEPFQTPDGACYGVGAPAGELAAVFPGQGAQYPGMGRDLACVFPAALAALEAAEDAFAGGTERAHGMRLVDRMIPTTAWDEAARSAQADALRATEVAQPAIGAASLGAWRVLEAFGLAPACVAGHSYGELTALAAAGRLTEAEFFALSVLRGRLMAGDGGDRGAMIAVSAAADQVAAWLAELGPELVVANKNAPTQVVVAGPTAAIAAAEAALTGRGVRTVRLPVGAAFHSPLVAGAEAEFAAALATVAMPAGRFPVYANTSGAPYPAADEEARALLAGQLARPVEWVAQIEAMYAAGARTFLEIGPGARLTGLVKAVLGDRPCVAIAVDASAGWKPGLADLARVLAALAAHGHRVALRGWQGGEATVAPLRARKAPKMAVPISGANHRSARPARPPRPTAGNGAAPHAGMPVGEPVAVKAVGEPVAVKAVGGQNGAHGQSGMGGMNGANGVNGHHPAPGPTPVSAAIPVAAPLPAPAVRDDATMSEAVKAASDTLAAWQKMQEQTAQLHRTFLEGQQAAQDAFKTLIDHQRDLLGRLDGGAPPRPVAVASVPVAASSQVTSSSAAPPPPTPVVAPMPVAALTPAAVPTPAVATSVMPVLLAVVSEKTGYPTATLSPEMALEADLGIDSIKRVEIMSALAERLPQAPIIRPEQLGTLHTLAEVAAALSAGTPDAGAPASAVPAAPGQAPVVGAAAADTVAAVVAVVAEKTGYPAETLDLDMALEADLGIDSIKRVEIMSALAERLPGTAPVAPDRLGAVATLRDVAALLAPAGGAAAGGATAGGTPNAEATPAPATSVAPTGDVLPVLLAVVADKTGYPPETLELDMALEADLGIDSIKRVEILSALAERLPGAAPIAADQAGTLATLRDVALALTFARAAVQASAGSGVAQTVIAVVAEKTGYPTETLEPSMALEADLGIDSIKRVEILSTLAERLPDAPALRPDALGTLATLGDVIAALAGTGPALAASAPDSIAAPATPTAAATPPGAATPTAAAAPAVAPTAMPVASAVVAPTSPDLPPMPLTGAADPAAVHGLVCDMPVPVALGDGSPSPSPKAPFSSEVWVAGPTGAGLAAAVTDRLTALGYQVGRLSLDALDELPARGSLAGLIVIGPTGTDAAWSEADEAMLKAAFRLVAHAGPSLRAAGKRTGAWLATVSRLDGAFGCAQVDAAYNPAAGALAGLAKTAGLEWPEVVVQALDVHVGWEDAEAAAAVVAELFLEGPTEVGLGPAGRLGLELVEAGPAPAGDAPLAAGDLVVVTGGARGVTAEVAVALARAYRPTLALLGRTPLPAAEPAWLEGVADEADVKKAIAAQADGPVAPREIEARWRAIAAAREVGTTLARLEALGVTARYVAVDVRDPAAVAAALAELRAAHGPVRGLVHGAGVLADKLILDKTQAQFDQVFDTKIAGLRALLGALALDEAKAIVLFSSVTARCGRVGQADYAMANELLNKAARRLAATRPGCRVLSVDWGPWDGGMVTPALKRLFAEEGVGVVPLEGGAAWLADELSRARPGAVELVVLGTPPGAPRGGDPASLVPYGHRAAVVAPATPAPPATQATQPAQPAQRLRTAFRSDLAVRTHPFLASHVMNGKAVLPVAVIVEWMAHAALHANPGLAFRGLADFAVFKGVVLDSEPYGVRFDAGMAIGSNGELAAAVELRGDARDQPHARATVLLGPAPASPPTGHWSGEWAGGEGAGAYARGAQEAYRQVLFHGPEFRGITAIEAIGPDGVIGRVKAARAPAAWVQAPLRDAWITDPLALDAAFQLLILWSVETLGAPCLPCRAAGYRQYGPFPSGGTRVLARVTERKAGTATADVAFLDGENQLVAELIGAECAFDAGLAEVFRNNALAAPTAP